MYQSQLFALALGEFVFFQTFRSLLFFQRFFVLGMSSPIPQNFEIRRRCAYSSFLKSKQRGVEVGPGADSKKIEGPMSEQGPRRKATRPPLTQRDSAQHSYANFCLPTSVGV